jgi:hypothetical protein
MKTFLLLVLTLTGMAQTTKADTIDYWHVYYNKVKIAAFNEYNIHDITIKMDKVKSHDSITVKYFNDTPCSDCNTHLTVEDEKHHTIVACKGKGVGNPISFALKDLLAYKQRSGCNSFEIFYPDVPKFIFRIKFE